MFKLILILITLLMVQLTNATEMHCVPVKSCDEKLADSKATNKSLRKEIEALKAKLAEKEMELRNTEGKLSQSELVLSNTRLEKNKVIVKTEQKVVRAEKNHLIVSITANKRLKSIDTIAVTGYSEARVVENIEPGVMIQYELGNLVPMIGIDRRSGTLGLGWKF